MSKKKEEPECYIGIMRALSIRPRPKCFPPKWKVTIASNAPILAGRTIYLCDYHKKNLALRFEKVEKLQN